MTAFSSIKQAYTQVSELHTQRPNIKLRTLCILGCVQAYKLYKGHGCHSRSCRAIPSST